MLNSKGSKSFIATLIPFFISSNFSSLTYPKNFKVRWRFSGFTQETCRNRFLSSRSFSIVDIRSESCFTLTSFAQDTLKESLSDLNRILPAKKVVNDEWGRDPFVPIVGERFVSMKLTAIIYNDKKPAAIVNNKIIYVGDSVDGQKVVDITKQYVILRGMSGSYKLEVGSSPGQTYEIKKNP